MQQRLAVHRRLLPGPVEAAVERPAVALELIAALAEDLARLLEVVGHAIEAIALDRARLHADRAALDFRDDREAALGLDLDLRHAAVLFAAHRDRPHRAAPDADLARVADLVHAEVLRRVVGQLRVGRDQRDAHARAGLRRP